MIPRTAAVLFLVLMSPAWGQPGSSRVSPANGPLVIPDGEPLPPPPRLIKPHYATPVTALPLKQKDYGLNRQRITVITGGREPVPFVPGVPGVPAVPAVPDVPAVPGVPGQPAAPVMPRA